MGIMKNVSPSSTKNADNGFKENKEEVVTTSDEVTGVLQKTSGKKSVSFSDIVMVEYVERYDRSKIKTEWSRCSNIAKFEIRLELNTYKRREMVVHEASRSNTRYHSLHF